MHFNWKDNDGDEGSAFVEHGLFTISVYNDNGPDAIREPNEVYVSRDQAKQLRKLLKAFIEESE